MKYYVIVVFLTSTLFAQDIDSFALMNYSERALWILLSVVSILALVLSLLQFRRLNKKYMHMQNKQNMIKEAQDKIVSDMSENIYKVVQETVGSEGLLAQKIEDNPSDNDLVKVMNSEMKLFDMTSNLIEFLRLKSKKVEISNNDFKFVNLLNDISGSLMSDFENSNIELIYDIDSDIPYILIGDTLNLSIILKNLLDFSIRNRARKITMKVSKLNKDFSLAKKLNFTISTDIKSNIDESIFNYTYDEEKNKYEGLGLFIAKDLSLLMDGELIANNTKSNNIKFSLTIPFHSTKDTEQKYMRKLDKRLAKKRVLVVDDNSDSALSLEKIFLNFKYSVKVEAREEYLKNLSDFSMYDIVVLDERLFTTKAIKSLKASKCKVISLGNLFSTSEISIENLKTLHLKKPFTQERIFNVLSEFYIAKENKNLNIEAKESADILKVNKGFFKDTKGVTLDSFREFRGKKILLVEDNLINQKVITSILGKSEIIITIANNGEEALELVNSNKGFDLVLMDINMPVMDGYTASQIIRGNPLFNKLPIISLSALTSQDEVSQMYTSGMNGFISKPLRKEKLFSAFAMFMDISTTLSKETSDSENIELVYDGLNVKQGIEQTDGNSILYRELLSEFKDAYGLSDKVLKTLIDEHRYEQAKMLCLDLKGLSGSICAQEMYELSGEMHKQLIYKKYEMFPKHVQTYSYELAKLNKSIDLYVK